MDTKTLLEQWNGRMVQGNKLSREIEDFENILEQATNGEVCVYQVGTGTTFLNTVLGDTVMYGLSAIVVKTLVGEKSKKESELERLINPVPEQRKAVISPDFEEEVEPLLIPPKRKPAVINPEFEAAVKEMEEQHGKPKVEEVVKKIIEKPVMTVDAVTKLYLEENKSMAEVAEYFGVNKTAVNNFVYNNHLSKKSYSKQDGFRDVVIEQKRKERP